MDPLITQIVKQAQNNDPRLRHLSLRSLPLMEVTNEEIFAVVESLQFNTHVSTFDMSLHQGDDRQDQEFAENEHMGLPGRNVTRTNWIPPPFETILAHNSSLVDVRISASCSFILASVFRGLAANRSVQTLQVGEMSASAETTSIMPFHCAKELQSMLERNNTMHRFALQGFRWEDTGALQCVCSGLRANHALQVLELLQILVAAPSHGSDTETEEEAPPTEDNNIPKTDLAIPFDEERGYTSKQMQEEAEAKAVAKARASAACNLILAIGSMVNLKKLCIIACEIADVAFDSSAIGLDVDITAAPPSVVESTSHAIDWLLAQSPGGDQEQQQHPHLEELRLVECELTGLSILNLQQGCRHACPFLHVLDVRSNSLEDDSCSALAEILHSACSLRKVILEDNNIGDDGLTLLARKGLEGNSTLQELCLKDNSFGPRGVHELASVLKTNESMQRVDLSYNFLGNDGAVALGAMLCLNKTLTDLVLENAVIAGEGVKGLCKGLLESSSGSALRKLNLSGNPFGTTGTNALCALLTMRGKNGKPCPLTSLRLASCHLGDVGVAALARALESNSRLEEIILPFNRFGDEGAVAIGQSLPKWKGLMSLQIQFNLFGESGFDAIVSGLSQNLYLKSLYLLNAGPSNRTVDKLFQDMQHWTRLNRAGRRVLHEEKKLPFKGLWPHVLARATNAYATDGLYFMLREQPEIVETRNRHQTI
ncbi:Ribonuclease inhibitor [Seminavis robusta]|uniref:Ribonuclease inhibitor n=1 Tax=Seminavis robusta TaxID=568900 RepID=A0A9N8H3K3_9STRA|nr:Ribonuclease inhibitor [Seminavis robusta]|eukprot:Sro63_g035630.1 Ribonuclease inhibitor (712) ;mRNA; r:13140-15347